MRPHHVSDSNGVDFSLESRGKLLENLDKRKICNLYFKKVILGVLLRLNMVGKQQNRKTI